MRTSRKEGFLDKWGMLIFTALLSVAVTWGVTTARIDYQSEAIRELRIELEKRASIETVIQNNQTMAREHAQILSNTLDASNRIGVLERRVDVNSNRLDALERRTR